MGRSRIARFGVKTRPFRKGLNRKTLRRYRPGKIVLWGTLRRTQPFSDRFGFERGRPVDRYYIDRFISCSRDLIRGAVMEMGDAYYIRQYPAQVSSRQVVDVDPSNAQATLIADLNERSALPQASFDCILLTQTLHLLRDEGTALTNLYGSLRPGGSMLITVPCVARVDQHCDDYWRYTPLGLEQRLTECCRNASVEVRGYGNVLVAAAALMGLAWQELRTHELEQADPRFPTVACARVVKPADSAAARTDRG